MLKNLAIVAASLVVLLAIALAVIYVHDSRRRVRQSRDSIRELLDVNRNLKDPIRALVNVKSAKCREATVEEIRASKFAKVGDLMLELRYAQETEKPLKFEVSEYVRLLHEELLEQQRTKSLKGEFAEIDARFEKFGLDMYWVRSADCADWEASF